MRIKKVFLILFFVLTVVGLFGVFKITRRTASKSDPPVIEDTIKNLHVNCDFSYEDLSEGLTATDDKDGDITDQIMIGELSDLENGNTCTYKCGVFDSDGQYSEITRTVIFDDYELPKIYLSGPLLFYISSGNKSLRELISAKDMLEGDITHRIQLSGSDPNDFILEKTEGDGFVTVTIDNSFHETAVYTLPFHVQSKPSSLNITLSDHLVYCTRNSRFDPMNFVVETSNDTVAGDTGYTLSVKSNVDMSRLGVYEVEYTLTGETVTIPAREYLIVIVYK